MNAITKPIPFNSAMSFLQGLVYDAVDAFEKQGRSIDAFDIACHIEATERSRIVQYVKDRTDWASVVSDDFLLSADEIRTCYADPSLFPALVDAALFKHFQNLLEWSDDINAILTRSHYIKAESDEHEVRVRPYVYEKL